MFCPKCNAEIEEHVSSCPTCGSALAQDSAGGNDPVDAAESETVSQVTVSDGSSQVQDASTSHSPDENPSAKKEEVIKVNEVRVGGTCSACGGGPLTYRSETRKTIYPAKDYVLPVFIVVAGVIATIALFITQGPEGVFLDRTHRGLKILMMALPIAFAIRIWTMRKGYKNVIVCSCPSCGVEYPVKSIPEEGTW